MISNGYVFYFLGMSAEANGGHQNFSNSRLSANIILNDSQQTPGTRRLLNLTGATASFIGLVSTGSPVRVNKFHPTT